MYSACTIFKCCGMWKCVLFGWLRLLALRAYRPAPAPGSTLAVRLRLSAPAAIVPYYHTNFNFPSSFVRALGYSF